MRFSSSILGLALMFTACSGGGAVSVGDQSIGEQALPQVMPGPGPVEVPVHGKELWFAVGALTGAPGINANGVTQAHYLEDGNSIVTIQLNIERAPEGSFYEAWLVGATKADRISLGHLRTPFGDVRHSLKYLDKTDVRSYGRLEITREKDDGDPAAGIMVAEGTLKARER